MLGGAKELMDCAGRADARDLGLPWADDETDSMMGLWLCISRVIFTPSELLVLVEMSSVVQYFPWLPAKLEACVPSHLALLTPGFCRTLAGDSSHHKTHHASLLVPVTKCVRGLGRRTCCRWRAGGGDSLPPSSSEDQCQKAGYAPQPDAASAAPSPEPQPVSGCRTEPCVSSCTVCTTQGSTSLLKNAINLSVHPPRGHSHS